MLISISILNSVKHVAFETTNTLPKFHISKRLILPGELFAYFSFTYSKEKSFTQGSQALRHAQFSKNSSVVIACNIFLFLMNREIIKEENYFTCSVVVQSL